MAIVFLINKRTHINKLDGTPEKQQMIELCLSEYDRLLKRLEGSPSKRYLFCAYFGKAATLNIKARQLSDPVQHQQKRTLEDEALACLFQAKKYIKANSVEDLIVLKEYGDICDNSDDPAKKAKVIPEFTHAIELLSSTVRRTFEDTAEDDVSEVSSVGAFYMDARLAEICTASAMFSAA